MAFTNPTRRPFITTKTSRPRRSNARTPSQKSSAKKLPNWATSLPFISIHLVCLTAFWTGVDAVSITLCVVLYLVRMFGITGAYHRYFAHRTYKTTRWFQFALACLGCSAMQKGPLWWAGHHREHHIYSDTEDDPHSPRANTFWWAHIGWVLAEDFNHTSWNMVRDWKRYPELRWLNRNHWLPGIVLGAACFLIDGWSGLVVGFFLSTVLLYHAVFTVNSLCHLFGSRRFKTDDDSRNNWLVAILTLGEGWHNNHHHYQTCANQGFRWWEIDITYYVLHGLQAVGLIWKIRSYPHKKRREKEKALATVAS
jgi:stearoyl-CoA desaturase (delta-9 desaturase)